MQALLDSSQRAFVRAPSGNIRLLAPAGCGKTLCLLYRCKHLTQVDSKRRIRLLVVTFTVAANQELQARLHEDPEFASLGDRVEITTLNSWGWRRVRNTAFNPRLITSTRDYHFAMLNQLQTIWQNHPDVKRAIEENKFRAPRPLMNVIDALKSLGFDHVRHTDYRLFSRHVDTLVKQNLGWRLIEQINELKKHDVISEKSIDSDVTDVGKRTLFDTFFRFWIEASEHMRSNATFTLEDQQIFLSDAFERLLNLLTIKADSGILRSSRKVANEILQLCDLIKRYPLSRADKESVRRHLQDQRPRSLNDAVRSLAGYRGRLKGSNNDGTMSGAMAEAVQRFLEADTVSDTLICLNGYFDGLQSDLGKAEDDVFFIDPPFLQLAEYASNYGDDYDRFVDDIERAKVSGW